MMQVDVLIVGQGLAGSTLAWRLVERGVSVLVVDRSGRNDQGGPSASRVAAGLMTPVTGRRLTLDPNWEEHRLVATAFYRDIERDTRTSVLHEHGSIRFLSSAEESRVLFERLRDERYRSQVESVVNSALPAGLRGEWEAFLMPNAARLDVDAFLKATRSWLASRGAYAANEIDLAADLVLTPLGVRIARLGIEAKRVVDCRGFTRSLSACHDAPTITPVKGEVLLIETPSLGLERVAHRGIWLAPSLDRSDRYLLGATYEPGEENSAPTVQGRKELLEAVGKFCDCEIRVVEQRAGIRPVAPDRQPTAELSSIDSRIAWFNGLGAKGALWAPWYADRLAEKLVRSLAEP